jgi:hypothetical protein
LRFLIFRIFLSKTLFFTAVMHIFRIFIGALPDYFIINSANTQNKNSFFSNHAVKKEKRE